MSNHGLGYLKNRPQRICKIRTDLLGNALDYVLTIKRGFPVPVVPGADPRASKRLTENRVKARDQPGAC